MDASTTRTNREYNNLYRRSNELYHQVAVKMGLSDSAFEILYSLDYLGDGCLQKEVCTASGLTKQTVNSSVHKLVRAGIVELRVERGRSTHICLTEAGRRLVEERIRPVARAEEAAFAAMSPEECEELLRLSRTYLEHLRCQIDVLPLPEGR